MEAAANENYGSRKSNCEPLFNENGVQKMKNYFLKNWRKFVKNLNKLSLIGHSPVSSFDYVNDSDKTGNNEILISKTQNVLNTKKMSNISVYFFSILWRLLLIFRSITTAININAFELCIFFWQSFKFDGWLVNRN